MKLHNKNSYLTNQSEGRAQKRIMPKITQLLYILFVLFVFLYIVYLLFYRSFAIKTDGVIEVEKYRIAATHGGKIENLQLKQGDTFTKGQNLVVVGAAKYCRPTEVDPRISRISYNISDEEISLRGMIDELNLLKARDEQTTKEELGLRRALDLNAPLLENQTTSYELAIKEQLNKIALQRLTIKTLQQRLASLEAQPIVVNSDPSCFAETITAPFDGYVYSISILQNEVSNRGETILTIVDTDADVGVEVYLENDLYDSVGLNRTFTVTLPNGTESTAIVTRVNTSAITQSDREWSGYEPVIPSLRVHLVPENTQDIPLWKQYDRYRVNVWGMK